MLGVVFGLPIGEGDIEGMPDLYAWSEGEYGYNDDWMFLDNNGKEESLSYPFNLSEGESIYIAGEIRDLDPGKGILIKNIHYNIVLKLWDAGSNSIRACRIYDFVPNKWVPPWEETDYYSAKFEISIDRYRENPSNWREGTIETLKMPYKDLYFILEVYEEDAFTGDDDLKEKYGGVIYGEESRDPGTLAMREPDPGNEGTFWRALEGMGKAYGYAFDGPYPFNVFLGIILLAIDGMAVYAIIFHARPGWWLFGGR